MISYRQPWLSNRAQEIIFILAPSLLPVLIVLTFPAYFLNHDVSSLWWVVLVLCIDVSHVYSTLFRLYWDRPTFQRYKRTLIFIPVIASGAGIALHYYSAAIFWRVLAYVAAYHFVRQQYGFMRLYSRYDPSSRASRIIDTLAIYSATLYPLAYWHLHLTKQLSWFVEGDFIALQGFPADNFLLVIYLASLTLYIGKEIVLFTRSRIVNIPKTLIVAGTYASWYVGIVLFQGDLVFTLLNVVAHGIPYMGLIWIYGEHKARHAFSFTWRGVLIFAGVLLLLAYLEEGLWDLFVWKDHTDVFPFFTSLPEISSHVLLSIVVPLLVLPQITHYVLDGFIWRFSRDRNSHIE